VKETFTKWRENRESMSHVQRRIKRVVKFLMVTSLQIHCCVPVCKYFGNRSAFGLWRSYGQAASFNLQWHVFPF